MRTGIIQCATVLLISAGATLAACGSDGSAIDNGNADGGGDDGSLAGDGGGTNPDGSPSACGDTSADPKNCGKCGNACAADKQCVQGACACATYTADCGSGCKPVVNDPQNCGGCGKTCTAPQVCTGGGCADSCLPGTEVCGGACVDKTSDNDHCGTCGNKCPAGQGCVNGVCRSATAVGSNPNCANGGPPIQVGGGGSGTCSGTLATKTFTWAICSCKDVQLSGYALVDGFDSTKGPYVPGQMGAGVGYNDGFQTSSSFDIWGTMWGGGTAGFQTNSTATVKYELHSNGQIKTTAPSFPVGSDAWVNGAVDGKFAFAKTLYMPSGQAPIGGATYQTLVNNAAVSVPKPCACEAKDIPPIVSWVDARAASNDNALINLSSSVLDQPATHTRIDLPCGSYYFTKIQNGNAVTVVTHGRTAIYVGGDIQNAAPLAILPAPGSELDIVVKGIIKAGASLRLGATSYPAATRIYAGGNGEVLLASDTLLGSNLYAANANLSWSSTTDAFGAVFAGDFKANSVLKIHYDRAIVATAGNCPGPGGGGGGSSGGDAGGGCGSCRDCNNQACINGKCGSCTDSSQCCAPLVCQGGVCVQVIK
jgi:hypothetical protein